MVGRYLLRIALALLVVLTLGVSSSTPVRPNSVRGAALSYLYSLPTWELTHFWGKWLYALEQPLRGGPPSDAEAKAQVREFFRLGDGMSGAQADLDRASSVGDGAARRDAVARLDQLEEQRDRLQPQVEAILEAEIARVLKEEGLTVSLGPWGGVFPPVDFTFTQPPFILAVSPRNRINLDQTVLLTSDLTLDNQEAIEARVERLGLSALTEQVGGVATYPAMIPELVSLEGSFTIASHEWVHHYLFFHPLGRKYGTSPEMTTVNETLADIAGGETGRRALLRLFPELAPPDPPAKPMDSTEPPPPPKPGAFDFNREMRLTRLTVEEMLANGEVEAAEAYMRRRQQFLAEHGYYIRKLNQAYFAWHGTYADTPASISPVGGWLTRLRQESLSLGEFVRRVSAVSSYEEFLRLVGQQP